MVKLTSRLAAVFELIEDNSAVADIGTDHAKLPAQLVLSGKSRFAIAADIRSGPLLKAKETVEKYNVQDKVSLVLSDGLENVDLSEITDIVIAGMGGEQIVKIIDACDINKIKKINFILQPMKDPEFLRRYLCENGFEICKERAVTDRKFVYCVMKVKYTGNRRKADRLYYSVGKLRENSDKQSLEYIKRLVNKQKKIISGLEHSSEHFDLSNEHEFLKLLEQVVKDYECK